MKALIKHIHPNAYVNLMVENEIQNKNGITIGYNVSIKSQ